jgi:hypothetical protein
VEVGCNRCATRCRVLYFHAYLEVMTLLEEQHSGKKDIHGHKLFRHVPRQHFVPSKEWRVVYHV